MSRTTSSTTPRGGRRATPEKREVDRDDLRGWMLIVDDVLEDTSPQRRERLKRWWNERVARHLRGSDLEVGR